MAVEMHKKFDKYWSEFSTTLAIAVILDPRYKYQFVEWCYNKLYGKDSAQLTEVRDSIFSLFAAYMKNTQELPSTSRSSPDVPHFTPSQDSVDVFMEDFDTFEAEELTNTVAKSQLEMYLDEPKLDRRKELDVLEYWRGNQFRYPELAMMARDVLAIPVSTVASESAFSVGGRVVDKFRSALKPSTVEALVTIRDWIFGKKDDMEPSLDELCEDVTKLAIRDTDGGEEGVNLSDD